MEGRQIRDAADITLKRQDAVPKFRLERVDLRRGDFEDRKLRAFLDKLMREAQSPSRSRRPSTH